MGATSEGGRRCSFCGKPQDAVAKLIAGPGVYICDECVELCNDVLDEELPVEPDEAGARAASLRDQALSKRGEAQRRVAEAKRVPEAQRLLDEAMLLVTHAERLERKARVLDSLGGRAPSEGPQGTAS